MITPFLLSALAAVPPQEPTAPAPGGLLDAAARLHRSIAAQRTVLFATPQADGTTWVRGGNYKACFAGAGWTFVPEPPAGAVRLEPLQFRLTDVRVGGEALPVGAPQPVRDGQRVVYEHGGFAETIDVAFDGVEQQFVFAELPARGELALRIAATGLPARAEANGLAFASAGGTVTYSAAVAIDAAGRRIAAPTTLAGERGDQIAIRVPAEFVAAAVLPLTIDPAVAFAVPQTAGTDLADPDVCAWLAGVGTFPPMPVLAYSVVYANFFGATDWDCYVANFDGDLVPLAGPYVIDLSTDGWARPRIASVNFLPRLLVVAQVRTGASVNRVRACHAFTGTGGSLSIGTPFDVSNDTVDCLRPDVGGDPSALAAPQYFTIVWERAFSANDHDIYMRQVTQDGVLRPGPYPIQTNTLNQSNPAISKCCGRHAVALPDVPVLAIVYQERAAAGNEDIHGALLTAAGFGIPVNGSYTFPIDTSFYNDIHPTVSSPTTTAADGHRRLLAAWERTNSNGGDIMAACLRSDGVLLAAGNVSALENDPTRLAWPQRRPSVDSDGHRFGVGYHEVYAGNTVVNDLDTRLSLVALAENAPGGPVLVVEEPATILGFSTDREFNMEVASAYGATGLAGSHYCTTNDRDNTNNTFAIDVRTYRGVPQSTVTTRATGCGSATIAATGLAQIGSTLSFAVGASAVFAGIAIGDTIAAPIPGCSGCTLGVGNGLILATPYALAIPLDITLIGTALSAQGIALVTSGGACFGSLQLTDTIDFRVQ